jgi:sugar O-acyltransferase (sialic acid O-acetyltransferase NeuD family)
VTREIVIIGCGGHGREVFGIIQAINAASPSGPVWRVAGFVDDKPSAVNRERVDRLGVAYLGPIEWLGEVGPGTHIVIGIGDPATRRAIDDRIQEYGLPVASVIHPLATVGAGTVAGDGLVAFAGSRVTTNVTLGRHVHLNQNCTIGHDCVLEDHVSVNPLAAVSGVCHVGAGVLVGTNAAILQQIRVGAGATVGAGACVTRDVPPGAVVKGVPAQ